MAVDKLVDSTQLDTDLTSVANAIRIKGGTSAQLAFPAGFVTAIDAIPTGGGSSRIKVLGNFSVVTGAGGSNVPDVLYLENCVTDNEGIAFAATYSGLGNKTFDVDIKGKNFVMGSSSTWSTGQTPNAIRKVTCSESPNLRLKLNVTSYGFRACSKLEEIHPLLDFSGRTSNMANFWNNSGGVALKYVRCVPNTSSYNIIFNNSDLLDDDSIVSIANALKTGTAKTLTMHATVKTKMNSILGTVSSVTDDTGTYDFFTKDSSGTVTLTNFVTTVKGWTLA